MPPVWTVMTGGRWTPWPLGSGHDLLSCLAVPVPSTGLPDGSARDFVAREILPLIFPETTASVDPVLVLVARPPGSIAAPATGRLVAEHGRDIAVVNGDDLRALHPDIAGGAGSTDAVQADSAEWLRACIAFARENRRSLLLDGQFSPAAALGTAERFADAGFRTRVVVTGARRAESLLSAVSLYLRSIQSGGSARLVGREAHDRGFEGARELAAALEESTAVDRVTVLGRNGTPAFDAERRDQDRPFQGASAALRAVQSERLTSLQSTQWLSELRRVTEFSVTLRQVPRPLTELLIDLHETALREIIPELPVPAGSAVVAAQERRSAAELVALRRSLVEERPADVAAPVVVPAGPDRGGLSR
ncbi:zeta toxin family protein [Microbacterium sp.]|uniref:zeta toxin family protein n=1 Tax=Microbacterium sp. TaxID=51671 RepID=UPI003C13B429